MIQLETVAAASAVSLHRAPLWKDHRGPVVGQEDAKPKSTDTAIDPEETSLGTEDVRPMVVTGKLSNTRRIATMAVLASLNFLSTLGSGILIAALPQIAIDTGLSDGLILWPAVVYSLAAGSLLLIFGVVADVVGPKLMWVTGSYLYVFFTLGIGFSRTGIQLILFRTFQGVSISMSLPTTISFVTNTFPRGTWRNTAFAVTGVGYPLGFALGLVLGGVFTDRVSWRWAYYMMAIINFSISTVAVWSLPSIHRKDASETKWFRRLARDIDWLGTVVLSAALGLLLYVLGILTTSTRNIREPHIIALLVVSIALLVFFPFWMKIQTKAGRPALIPNKLWRNITFTSICISVFLSWASLNGIEYFTTLYFQQVQRVSALDSSLRFLPHVFIGVVTNLLAGYLVSRVHVRKLAVISAVITAVAPALMATAPIDSNYWFAPFWALVLSPVNPDVLFTVSSLVISDTFPADVQSLAGGVFNEIAQFGNSVGLAVAAAVAMAVSEKSGIVNHEARLMQGFRAAYWAIFSAAALIVGVTWFGLRKGAVEGYKELAEVFLETYAIDPNTRNHAGQTPLFVAAARGNREVVELLLEQDGIELDLRDDDGQTPLFAAAAQGHREVGELLVKRVVWM
ncbi:major facilitator superfamily domain-containing protein [Xylariaceae sp. AK1471]|nr:major facilitator superfamily domain-containing protein [Xylariaceae sp. AK1471]